MKVETSVFGTQVGRGSPSLHGRQTVPERGVVQ